MDGNPLAEVAFSVHRGAFDSSSKRFSVLYTDESTYFFLPIPSALTIYNMSYYSRVHMVVDFLVYPLYLSISIP